MSGRKYPLATRQATAKELRVRIKNPVDPMSGLAALVREYYASAPLPRDTGTAVSNLLTDLIGFCELKKVDFEDSASSADHHFYSSTD